MKKLLPLICLICAVMACNQHPKTRQTANKSVMAAVPDVYTLNGLTKTEATTIVQAFRSDRKAVAPASVFFGLTDLEAIDKILTDNNADGVRVYYGKTAANQFKLVLVPTKGNGTTSLQRPKHDDFFLNTDPGINAGNAVMEKLTGPYTLGATLLDPTFHCPNGLVCGTPHRHYLDCNNSFKWVQNYMKLDFKTDTIDTNSEWFESCLISDLCQTLKNNHGDGIRVYFSYKNDAPSSKHRFVITTTVAGTSGSHKDKRMCVTLPTCARLLPHDQDFDNGEQCPNNCEGSTW
ncbi:hypothetical protein MUY27_12055 [Mucilaginibacter sp. RS28]|uniref:Uncharacterized protein n=1 Tax=Mucilaginibacter straminoryzae TaxID=2932774 RepID=A0A9X1X4L3_9SPHI|nr:hypothetical protein [Mucilaginibacter straminoryzae]MCJ8210441.1 hypothetical protein [Mucilaginibacter straminoryzae]